MSLDKNPGVGDGRVDEEGESGTGHYFSGPGPQRHSVGDVGAMAEWVDRFLEGGI